MLKTGIAGFGFMGRMHYRCWNALPGVEVVAVCDTEAHALEDAAKNRGNIAGADGDVDLANVEIYDDFARMLRQEQLHAVSITVPTYLHATYTIAALDAGVHVLCEKPMALNVADCNPMIAAANRSGKMLQIGHCTRFWPEYMKAKEIIDGGEYGRVIAATFRRFAATAVRKAGSWFTSEKRSGGMVLDLHIHDTDFVQYLFGMPRAVCSFGASGPGEGLAHIITHYCYDDEKMVTAEGGWAMTPAFGFEMGFHVVMEKATVAFDYKRRPALRLCPVEGEEVAPELEGGDGYSLEIAHFAKLVSGDRMEAVTTPEQSRNSIKIVEAEQESVQRGEKVSIV